MNKKIIWVKAKCNDYYKFMQKLQYLNLTIMDIKYDKKIIYLKMEEKEIEKIKKYLVSYKFKKVSNLGIFNLIDKIKTNKIFVICLLIGGILFLILSNLVVKINIIHENKEIRDIIAEELNEYGIKLLSFKKSYKELDIIRQKILDKYPDKLDWMEFDVDGMIINVRVEERIITEIIKNDAVCDLVATKSGVINDILVSEGNILVNINDYVREGDTLVSGIINYNEENKRYTCANGKVFAKVWYTANVSIPLEYTDYIETGKKKYNFIWEINGNKKRILKNRFVTFNSSIKNLLSIFDFKFYVETQKETEKVINTYTEDQALEQGINKAIESIKIKLGEFDEIIDKKVLKKTLNNSTMDVEVFVIAKELISTQKEITIDNTEEGNE